MMALKAVRLVTMAGAVLSKLMAAGEEMWMWDIPQQDRDGDTSFDSLGMPSPSPTEQPIPVPLPPTKMPAQPTTPSSISSSLTSPSPTAPSLDLHC
jgi:hypothetical protein